MRYIDLLVYIPTINVFGFLASIGIEYPWQMVPLPLAHISKWTPFQFDALGLVTIFGAKEMSTSIGNLVHSWATDWVPTLGSYAVANDEIAAPEPGFVLYNITDGIMALDVAPWFTRWLMSFPLTYTATIIRLKMDGKPRPLIQKAISIGIGLLTTGCLLTLAVLTDDLWGIGNVVAMALSVLVRQQMVSQRRAFVDQSIQKLSHDPGQDVKVFLTLPNGKAVTILGPCEIVIDCILTSARPVNPHYYYLLRVACWAIFGAHAITLGMSSLFNQIISVCVLLLGTYLTAVHVGDCREAIGRLLRLEVEMGNPDWLRPPVYARLEMSETEEDHMVHWSMLPQRSNTRWWDEYQNQYMPSLRRAKEETCDSNSKEAKSSGSIVPSLERARSQCGDDQV